jgi:hypothetical protein
VPLQTGTLSGNLIYIQFKTAVGGMGQFSEHLGHVMQVCVTVPDEQDVQWHWLSL